MRCVQHSVEADIRDLGKLPRDAGEIVEAGEITRGNAQHFALLEFTKPGEGWVEVAPPQGGLEPGVDFPAQSLFRPGMLQLFRVERSGEPVGVRDEQFA